ncbi:hypothetical protein VTJ83DRAFT_7505 [Remersonia thermophila]|uniref:Ribonuclease H n=1 Tax=Remersonia thermophila TaxID=72144 RepID=A0ABR4D3U9_9PEZI
MSSQSKKRAAPGAAGSHNNLSPKKRRIDSASSSSGGKYYAVRVGAKPGIYTSWAICQQQISGFKGAVFKSFTDYEDASAFVQGRNPTSAAADNKPPRFYGVAVGRTPGVYTEWSEAQEAIKGWKMPKYRKFDTREEAEEFVRTYRAGAAGDASAQAALDGDAADEEPVSQTKTAAMASLQQQNSVVVVYTDGSSRANGRADAAAGVGVYFGPGDPRNISERLKGLQTNQRAELTAILRALESVDLDQDLEIRTDSKYSIRCVTEWYINWERNGWRTQGGPVKNADLVQDVRKKIEEREAHGAGTQFIWVKGHAMDPGNIAADKLAVDGAMKPA